MPHAHRQYEPFGSAESMQEDLGLFEAATHPQTVELPPVAVRALLVVEDGSHQDATALAMGQALAARFSATLHVRGQLHTAQQIQQTAQTLDVDLVVVPVPCGESLQQLGSQSLGSVADSLLASDLPLPLLCIRQPLPAASCAAALQHVVLPLTRDHGSAAQTVSWGCRLTAGGGTLRLLELADAETIEDARKLLAPGDEPPSLEQATVGRALSARWGPLVGAAQHAAHAAGFAVQVEFRWGQPVPQILAAAAALQPALLVAQRAPDHTSAASHLATDLLLESPHAILLV